jgi:recombination protein RecR
MVYDSPLKPLVTELKQLPGVGEKSAQRLAFFLLSISKDRVDKIAKQMSDTRSDIKYCETCFNISLETICHICKNPGRDKDLLCIVAEPKDIFALEKTHEFKGTYHVLGGLISPIDGVHPEALRIPELLERLRQQSFKEIILAINPTIEGDTTVLYLHSVLKQLKLSVTKLAYGLPVGADIDYADELTLQRAFTGRRDVE